MKMSLMLLLVFPFAGCWEIQPRNTLKDCRLQCVDNGKASACLEFCDCIHKSGRSLDSCLRAYEKAGTIQSE